MMRFRDDPSLSSKCFESLFLPTVPPERTQRVALELSRTSGPAFVIYLHEHLAEFERRFEGQAGRRAAMLGQFVQSGGYVRGRVPFDTLRELARHQSQALEEAWLSGDRTPNDTSQFLSALDLVRISLGAEDDGGCQSHQERLARLAGPLGEAVRQEQRGQAVALDGGPRSPFEQDTHQGLLELEVAVELLQARHPNLCQPEASANRALASMLATWGLAHVEASSVPGRSVGELRRAGEELGLLQKLQPSRAVAEAVVAHGEVMRHVVLAEVARAALPELRFVADEVSRERAQLRCLRGTTLRVLGEVEATPLARMAYRQRAWEYGLLREIDQFPVATWPISRTQAQTSVTARAVEMVAVPCPGPGNVYPPVSPHRLVVITASAPAIGKSREFVGVTREQPDADGGAAREDAFQVKDLAAFKDFEATANADLAAAEAILKREEAAATAAGPRMRAALVSLGATVKPRAPPAH